MTTKTITPHPPADFTPDRQPYHELRPFRFWCQKVLPLVYDDSLSYYELLCKVVDYLNKTMEDVDNFNTDMDNLYTAYSELQDYVNNYFSTLDVQQEINNKLDQMVADGTLADLINNVLFERLNDRIELLERPKLSDLVTGFVGFNKGQAVEFCQDVVHLSQTFPMNVTTVALDDNQYQNISQPYSIVLDMPVDRFAFTIASDSSECWGINYNYTTNMVNFRLASQIPLANQNVSLRFLGMGRHRKPATQPNITTTKQNEVLECCKTYYNAKQSGREFAYGLNFTYNGGQNVVNNASGAAMMECDTLVVMTLLGIDYEDSPYANTTPGYTYNFNDLVVNPDGKYSWAVQNIKNDDTFGGRLTSTSSMNWYFWGNGSVFSSTAFLQNGDIAIFRRKGTSFDLVGHCGIIEVVEENGENIPYLYHISVAAYTEGQILARIKLEDFYKYGRYYPEDTYFVRLNWG